MTKRRPLRWYEATHNGTRIGVDGQIPDCSKCLDLLFSIGFTDAVYSTAIEYGDPAGLARRTIEGYHNRRHPAAEWGLGGR